MVETSSRHAEVRSGLRFEIAFRRLGLATVVAAAALGMASVSSDSVKWSCLAMLLHVAPAGMQFLPKLRSAGTWLAVFLVAQALVSLVVLPTGVLPLPPNLSRTIDIPSGVVPGLSARQHISTDELGFRVTRPIDYLHKPAGTLRIFALGGSTTEQHLLDDHRTWTHLLQQHLQSALDDRTVEVINAGTQGTRAVHHLEVLRRIAAYQPDVVLFLVGINDWNKQIREHFGSRAYSRWHAVRERIQFENTLLGQLIRRMWDAWLRLAGRDVVVSGGGWSEGYAGSLAREDRRSLVLDQVDADYAGVLDSIAGECARQGIVCVFLTQPTAYRGDAGDALKGRFWMTPTYESYTLDLDSMRRTADLYNGYLLGFAMRHELQSCDTAAAMAPPRDYFWDDCHMTEEGARVFAARLADCLLANGSLAARR